MEPTPGFSASTLTDPVYAFANTLLAGITELLLIVLPAAAAFTLLGIGVLMLKRWIGAVAADKAAGGWGRGGGREDFDYADYVHDERRAGNSGYGNRSWRKHMAGRM